MFFKYMFYAAELLNNFRFTALKNFSTGAITFLIHFIYKWQMLLKEGITHPLDTMKHDET